MDWSPEGATQSCVLKTLLQSSFVRLNHLGFRGGRLPATAPQATVEPPLRGWQQCRGVGREIRLEPSGVKSPQSALPTNLTATSPALTAAQRVYLYFTAAVTGAAVMIVEILGAKMLAP